EALDVAGDAVGRREPEPAPLAHGEAVQAAVPAERAAALVDHDAGTERAGRRVALDEGPGAVLADEAHLHALRLVGDGQAQRRGVRPHFRLRQLADREERLGEVGGAEREEEVRLVLRGVGRGAEARAAGAGIRADAGIVAGGETRGAELAGAPAKQPELDPLVAARARVRGAAREILVEEGLDDGAREGLGRVEDVVREAQPIGDGARVVEVVERAAAALLPPHETERDADHVVAGGRAAGRGDGAVDPAAHGDDHALAAHAAAPPRTCATRDGSRSRTVSTSAAVVEGPRLRRSPSRAASASR